MRLIDADALKQIDEDYMPTGKWLPWSEVLNAPTIDPVKHGKWKKLTYRDDSKGFKCSVCGGVSIIPTSYCGNCGALM